MTALLVAGAWWFVWYHSDPEESAVITPALPPNTQEVIVDHAIDGDSLQVHAVNANGPVVKTTEPVQLRLLGIDAPEVHGGEDRQAQCYATDAYRRLLTLAPAGAKLHILADQQKLDNFNRYLVWAWTDKSSFINEDLAAGGYARPLHIPPNDRYNKRIDEVVAAAQAANKGLWSACPA
ncbi:endonuclease YncB(thermonuclease family) [Allocatelliglobosispora scoriae]|uniref:Endonuclease YncB(Thermonuclease family) n=1 Tax=Allocatelliglobosispora scoriae TaxID=643052 RepID=A0A841BXZ7_9ACTN|nr:thermonuclease family protein [Allocatelliglobosispora scoriae]MBB5871803.1 endonuclease YncB(thermonuclease family) [Allocatelliglobosispora scoriae]